MKKREKRENKNCKLVHLEASYNSLAKLDLTENKKLEKVYCGNNNLSKLLIFAENEIASLDCERRNTQLPSDFLLYLKPKKTTELILPSHLKYELNLYFPIEELCMQ